MERLYIVVPVFNEAPNIATLFAGFRELQAELGSRFEVSYRGKAAHASSHPEQGINAADALVVATNGLAGTDWLVREVLKEAGDAVVLEPHDARRSVAAAAKRLA